MLSLRRLVCRGRYGLMIGILALPPVAGFAQSDSSGWVGEWGSFEQIFPVSNDFPDRALSIHACTGQRCSVSVLVQAKAGHGQADGFLQLESSTEAVAHLLAAGKEHCSLRLTLSPGQQPSIDVRQGAGDCSYFLTPGASFLHTYSLHTRETYFGNNIASCFAATTRPKLSICTSPSLTKQQAEWQNLFFAVAELKNAQAAGQEKAAEGNLLESCSAAAQVADCLAAAFKQSTDDLNRQKAEWLEQATAPGDPGQASQAAAAIAGTYRHSFQNADVQGDQFLSTNTLEIKVLPNSAIHYNLELQFYNGHQCEIEGTAAFRRDGFFLDQKETSVPEAPSCLFEILPGPDGVKFADPTGGCRVMSCGARGGYNGAYFSFKDRR